MHLHSDAWQYTDIQQTKMLDFSVILNLVRLAGYIYILYVCVCVGMEAISSATFLMF